MTDPTLTPASNPAATPVPASAVASGQGGAPTDPVAAEQGPAPSVAAARPLAAVAGLGQPASSGWFASTMLMVALLALVLSGLLWQRLDRIQQELARRSADVAEESEKSRDSADQALTLVNEMQARLSVAEVKLSEVSLQRSQLEELMLSVSRSRDDTLVLDIESGIRLAMQQAELTGSAQPLLSALQAADGRIAKAAQPRLNPVQRAMARDIDRIKASAVADLPLLSSRLDELARAVDDWPLANAEPKKRVTTPPAKPGKPAAPQSVSQVASKAETPVSPVDPKVPVAVKPESGQSADAVGVSANPEPIATSGTSADSSGQAPATDSKPHVPPPAQKKVATSKVVQPAAAPAATENAPPQGIWASLQTAWARGWSKLTEHVWAATSDLVRVSRIEEPDAVLLTPEQVVFLRENLKLRLLNARLSLLSRQVPAARADMQAVKVAMVKYFDPHATINKQAQLALADVLQASRHLDLPRPDDTLVALAKAAGGR